MFGVVLLVEGFLGVVLLVEGFLGVVLLVEACLVVVLSWKHVGAVLSVGDDYPWWGQRCPVFILSAGQ